MNLLREGFNWTFAITGTIERGHIFFFYRPRVEVEDVHSIDDIRNFHMLLIPRPPQFAVAPSDTVKDVAEAEADVLDGEMTLLQPGADAVPASDEGASTKKHYRLITLGKKKLPDSESSASGGGHRKQTFWATVTAVGDDLEALDQAFEAKTYETKTRGMCLRLIFGPSNIILR